MYNNLIQDNSSFSLESPSSPRNFYEDNIMDLFNEYPLPSPTDFSTSLVDGNSATPIDCLFHDTNDIASLPSDGFVYNDETDNQFYSPSDDQLDWLQLSQPTKASYPPPKEKILCRCRALPCRRQTRSCGRLTSDRLHIAFQKRLNRTMFKSHCQPLYSMQY